MFDRLLHACDRLHELRTALVEAAWVVLLYLAHGRGKR